VITGDLTDNASEKDFEILRMLFKGFSLLNTDRLSIVPGNHDIFGGAQTAEEILTFPQKCINTNYHQKIQRYTEYFRETYSKCIFRNEDSCFPFIKILDDVLIAGLNSVIPYSKITNPFASNGEIQLEQFTSLNSLLNDFSGFCKFKLVMLHHHFEKITPYNNKPVSIWNNIEKRTMKLRKKKRLYELFNKYHIDLILHGHYHNSAEYEKKGLRFLNAGATIKGRVPDEMNINFVNLSHNNITIDIHKLENNSVKVKHSFLSDLLEQADRIKNQIDDV
jgi:3',5'-cyclic AMP phosphodiesterase CpdA